LPAQREAEVEEDGLSFRTDKYVLGLNVPVDNPVIMAICERIGDLSDEIDCLSREGPAPPVLQAFPQRDVP
jgi:hypothetical protein